MPAALILIALFAGIYLSRGEHTSGAGTFVLIITAIGTGLTLAKAFFVWLRIRHTEYAVHPNQVQETSYLLKFLGARNNTVKLKEIKQLRCYSNGWLDVWFFNCGKIQMVTSGDQVDFIMENVHDPMKLKDQLELRLFGEIADNAPGLRASPGSPQGLRMKETLNYNLYF